MSPRVFLVVAVVLVAACLGTEATSYPKTWKIGKRICITQILARCPVWKKVQYKCGSNPYQHGSHFTPWSRQGCAKYNRKCCFRAVRVYVSCVINVKHCCQGWTMNRNYRCNVRTNQTACPGGCANNGTCDSAKGRCTCKPGFTGASCERAICSPVCENGGMCVAVNGTSQCKCPRAFQGTSCQTAVCEQPCVNGGKCKAIGARAVCWCPEGFFGKRCEIAVKEGDCPVTSIFQSRNCSKEHRCAHDQECPGDQKCCLNILCGGRYCVTPRSGCYFKNKLYALGEKFSPSPCKECTCIMPGALTPDGGVTCTDVRCPPMPPGYRRCKREAPNMGSYQCCKVCKDHEKQRPPNYTAPVFKNCPKDGIILDLPEKRKTVKVLQTLEAVDMRGRKLRIQYSKLSLAWNSDTDRNFHLIVATAMDEWEEDIECSFVVRLRDPHPPVFENCPHDVGPVVGPIVSWTPPTATDNAGLAGPPESDFLPGHRFPPGQTLVTYTVEDLEGNEELCQFFVYVLPRTTSTSQTWPTSVITSPTAIGGLGINDRQSQSSGHETTHGKLYIFIGLGVLLFLLILLASIFFFLRRNRRDKLRTPTPSVGFSAPMGAPPPYAVAAMDGAIGSYENVAVKTLVTDSNPTESFDNPVYNRDNCAYTQENKQNQASE